MEALKLAADLEVQEVRDRAGFARLEEEWDALVARTRDELFYRHAFLRVWIDNFAPRASLRVLTGRSEGKLVAVLPLVEERTRLYGIPVRELHSAANAHSCRFDLVADEPEAAGRAFFAHLAKDASWDVLRLIDVPERGAGWFVHAAAEEAGFPVGTWASLNSPYIPLPDSYEAYTAKLQSKFKANCRRRRKKLEEKGKVTFERFEGGAELEARLEEGFALEQSGWKGERGTAIAQDAATRGFYTELAHESARAGKLALYFLRLEGRAIAFHYGLVHEGRYLLLKPGYDESLKECSPGQLLMEEVVKDCIERGVREFDFLGPDMVWKRDWTEQARQHTWLFTFRNTAFGRALCNAKFRWVPAAKERLARWKS
jgi:CelD/BcsL family acetyltransferase involved in cellulose biosynthesis